MKIIFLFISIFLSWVAFDPGLFRRRYNSYNIAVVEFTLTEVDEVQQQKKVQQKRLDVIPLRYRNRKKPERMKVNYFSTKPRDVRFSNQRKIRRMFNNM